MYKIRPFNRFTFYNIYIKTLHILLKCEFIIVFTFYNIYIKTHYQLQNLHLLRNLHSIIFILKLAPLRIVTSLKISFTFYNIYIKTLSKVLTVLTGPIFTFYNIYIKTQ